VRSSAEKGHTAEPGLPEPVRHLRSAFMVVTPATIGVILAGGRGRRMFGNGPARPHAADKCLISLGPGVTMLDRIISRFRPQVDHLILNANGPADRFERFALDVVPDTVSADQGPLAGLLAALDWSERHFGSTARVVSVTSDIPFLPADLVSRLRAAAGAGAAIPVSDGQRHPAVGWWPVALRTDIMHALHQGERGIDRFARAQAAIEVAFPLGDIGGERVDPFFNANTPEDIDRARAWLSGQLRD
jgi:molybdenum cofactor guanylyltransferase